MFKLHKPHLSGSIHSGHFMVSRLDDDDDDQNDPGDDSSESERDNAQSVEIDVNNPDAVADAAKNLGISYQVQSPSAKSELVTDWNDLDRPAKKLHKPHQYLTYYTNSHSNLKTEERRRQTAAAAGAAIAGASGSFTSHQQHSHQHQQQQVDDDPASLMPMDATIPRASLASTSVGSSGSSSTANTSASGRYLQAGPGDDPRGGVATCVSGTNSLASSVSGLMAAAAAAAAASSTNSAAAANFAAAASLSNTPNTNTNTTTNAAGTSQAANAVNHTAASAASTTQAHLNSAQAAAAQATMTFSYLDPDCNKPRDLSNGGLGVLPAEQLAAALQSQHQMIPAAMHTCSHEHAHAVTIDTSLTKLLECMSLYYSSKLTSPKWKSFKGLKLRMKHKIRLNNLIWRAWFLQCIRGRRPPGCQFTAPAEEGVHKKSETHVLEGKYWKRKEKAIVDEYKKWRIFHKQRSQGHYFRPSSFDWDSRASNLVSCGPDEYSFYPDYDMNLSYNLDELPPMLEEELEHCQEQVGVGTGAGGDQGGYYQQPSLPAVSQAQEQVISSSMRPGVGISGAPMPTSTTAATTTSAGGANPPHQQQLTMTTSAGATLPPTSLQQQTAISSASQNVHHQQQQQMQPIISHQMHQLSNRLEQTHQQQQQQQQSHFNQQQQQIHQHLPMHPHHQTHQQQQQQYNHQNHLHHQQHQALSLKADPQQQQQQQQQQIASPQQLTISLENFSAQLPAQKNLQHHHLAQQQLAAEHQAFSLDGTNSLHQQLQQHQQHLTHTHLHQQHQHQQQQQHSSLNHHHHSQAPIHHAHHNHLHHNHQHYQHAHHLSTPNHLQQQQQQVTTDEEDGGQQQQDQLSYMNQDLMSVSSNASESSMMSAMGGGSGNGRQEQRRVCHINAEQKRRCNIKNGFDTLRALLPSVNQNVNVKISKASMLQKAAIHISNLSAEQKQQLDEQAILRQQIEGLRQSIRTYQAQLPATGAVTAGGVGGSSPGGNPAQSARARDMFQTYVRRRTLENWKFWIFSYVIEPLYETYYNTVNTNSLEDACKTIYTWLDQNCGMNSLRNDATDSLTLLGTRTNVLTSPETLPGEAVDAAVAAAAAAATAAANAATTAIGAAAANPTTTTTAHSSTSSSAASTSVSSPLGGVAAAAAHPPPQSSDILSSIAASSKLPQQQQPPHMVTSRPHPHQHQLHPSQLHQQVHQIHAQQVAAAAVAAASQQQQAVQQSQQHQQQSHNIQRSMW